MDLVLKNIGYLLSEARMWILKYLEHEMNCHMLMHLDLEINCFGILDLQLYRLVRYRFKRQYSLPPQDLGH